jgi:hypothetical protein
MKRVVLLVGVLLVGGCARMSVTELCSSYGFVPGTDAFAGCVMQVDLAARQRSAAIVSGHIAAQGARDAAAWSARQQRLNGVYGR